MSETQRFGAYVETFPFAWDVHVFPQALYCDDLGRRWGSYEVRGHMNSTFFQQVHGLAEELDRRAGADLRGNHSGAVISVGSRQCHGHDADHPRHT